MKPLRCVASAAALLVTTLVSAPVHASDVKMYHGSDCKVFGSTASTDLAFSGFGVKNLQTSPRNIICQVTKDGEELWDGDAVIPANNAQLSLRVQNGAVAANSTCTLHVTLQDDSTTVRSYTMTTGLVPAFTITFLSIAEINSAPGSTKATSDKAYMLCTLGPSVRLLGYIFGEFGATHLP